ncbi:MAG: divalent-cation tolerance protein CutA [Pseudomonadota bacterium]
MTDYIQVSTTTGREEDARRIAEEMVNKRLAACVQVIGPITSTYWWKGKIEKEKEWLCTMKTRRDLYESLEKAVKGIHPYEEPEIIAVPVVKGSRGYLDWVDREVKKSGA